MEIDNIDLQQINKKDLKNLSKIMLIQIIFNLGNKLDRFEKNINIYEKKINILEKMLLAYDNPHTPTSKRKFRTRKPKETYEYKNTE